MEQHTAHSTGRAGTGSALAPQLLPAEHRNVQRLGKQRPEEEQQQRQLQTTLLQEHSCSQAVPTTDLCPSAG